MNVDRFDDALCSVCARAACGIGHTPNVACGKDRMLWLCDDPECLRIAIDSYTAKQETFTRIEGLAVVHGGKSGGKYLEDIGVFDLSRLAPDQWAEFCRRLVSGYRMALKQGLKDEVPF